TAGRRGPVRRGHRQRGRCRQRGAPRMSPASSDSPSGAGAPLSNLRDRRSRRGRSRRSGGDAAGHDERLDTTIVLEDRGETGMWLIVFAVVLTGAAWTAVRVYSGLLQVTTVSTEWVARNRVELRGSRALLDLLERKEALLAEGAAAVERGDEAARARVLAEMDGVNREIDRLESEQPALLAAEEAREERLMMLLHVVELGFGALSLAGVGYALWFVVAQAS